MEPLYFASPAEWRKWLARHHSRAAEAWVGFHRQATGRPTLTWSESVDEALCFGWIDGIRKRVDETRYLIRFTPRRPGSTWSRVNVAKVAVLIRDKRIRAPGLKAWQARTESNSGRYSFEQDRENARLPPSAEAMLRRNRPAWEYWTTEAAWYRRTVSWWVISAKREETRARRLAVVLECCAAGERIGPLRR